MSIFCYVIIPDFSESVNDVRFFFFFVYVNKSSIVGAGSGVPSGYSSVFKFFVILAMCVYLG
jgi:hypothetical protein